MMKTISRGEYKTMIATLKEYYEYLKSNPESLITRYFGMHKIILKSSSSTRTFYFVLMKNIFRTKKNLKYKFDLKGSTYKRETVLRDPTRWPPRDAAT